MMVSVLVSLQPEDCSKAWQVQHLGGCIVSSSWILRTGVTPGVERLRTGACGVVVVVVSGGVTGSEMGRGIC
jgi:hypothetical protein